MIKERNYNNKTLLNYEDVFDKAGVDAVQIESYDFELLEKIIKKKFGYAGISISIKGKAHSPLIVIEESFILNSAINNGNLILFDAPYNGTVIKKINLESDEILEEDFIDYYLNKYDFRPYIRVMYAKTGLYLSGFHNQGKNRYPVFAKSGEYIYYDRKSAEDTLLNLLDYPLRIIHKEGF